MSTLHEPAPLPVARRELGPSGVVAGGATMARRLTVGAEAVMYEGVHVFFEEPTSDDEGIEVFAAKLNADACRLLIGVMQAYLDGEAQLAAERARRHNGGR